MVRRRLGGHGKPKLNPDRICKCCKDKIINKVQHSLYCKGCAKDVFFIRELIYQAVYRAKRLYPNVLSYDIKLTIIIKKKKIK